MFARPTVPLMEPFELIECEVCGGGGGLGARWDARFYAWLPEGEWG